MEQIGFYFNSAACIGCKTCVIACKDKNDLEVGRNFRRVYDYESGAYPAPKIWHISVACNHCDDPTCTKVCPTGAMQKRESDGVVFVDQSKCIGCQSCEKACAYGAPQLNEAIKKMSKCDTCMDIRADGESPACVDSCQMRALDFGLIKDLRARYGENADISGLPDSKLTQPNLVVGVKK